MSARIVSISSRIQFLILNKFTQVYTILHQVNIRPIDCTPHRGPENYTQRGSSTALCRLNTDGQGTKNPSHAAHHVPQTPTTTPDEDITSYITDTLLEREQTHQATLPDN